MVSAQVSVQGPMMEMLKCGYHSNVSAFLSLQLLNKVTVTSAVHLHATISAIISRGL